MPTFETAEPIQVTIEVVVADVRITASDRRDTVVAVRPTNRSDAADNKVAEQVQVEYAEGRLVIRSPKSWRLYTPFGTPGSVQVTLEVPTGSSVSGESSLGRFTAEGELGELRFKTAMGHIRVDHARTPRLKTSHGNVAVDRAVGHLDVSTGSGEVRLEQIEGSAVVKNANGDTRIGTVAGDLRIKASNGDIVVDRADRTVVARTACGDIRIDEVTCGVLELKTGAGDIEVGVHAGTAAWLDVSSGFGRVHNALDAADGPEPSDETVEVRARTAAGDIAIRRSGRATPPAREEKAT